MALETSVIAVAATATLMFHSDKGSFQAPQRVLIQNQDATAKIYIGGPDVTSSNAPWVLAGGTFEVALEAGEEVYAITASGTINAAVLYTRK